MTEAPREPVRVSLTADGVLTIAPWHDVSREDAFKIINAVTEAVQPILWKVAT
jgi:hypothetical protein